tara:strand:+ start:355 stop:537 length:183 start_codon:yes stop_codon:yes gene_type:complete
MAIFTRTKWLNYLRTLDQIEDDEFEKVLVKIGKMIDQELNEQERLTLKRAGVKQTKKNDG